MADTGGNSADGGGERVSQSGRQRHPWQPVNRGGTAGSSERDTAGSSERDTADPSERDTRPSTLRHLWALIQRLAGYGFMRASSPLRNPVGSEGPIRARAQLESTSIKERYRYRQDISLNAAVNLMDKPAGRIKFVLPFDGEKYFTRQAHRDVVRTRGPHTDPFALVGFLALTSYERTDLDTLSLWDAPGSIPIRVRLPQPAGADEADPLLADTSACVLSQRYRPRLRAEQLAPIHLDIALDEPDTADFSIRLARAEPGVGRVRIMRHVEFKPGLSLRVRARLHVPRRMADGARAKVSQVFIGWPTHTSLRSLSLHVDGQAHTLRYNPEWRNPDIPEGQKDSAERQKQCGLEWREITMELEPESVGGDIRTFRSPDMVLSIPNPGELYWQENITGRVQVTIDRLISGMDARLYDATGKRLRNTALKMKSVVSSTFSLNLDDAFARRTLSPYQQLYFGEIIPNSMRIDNIITALRNRGFDAEALSEPDPEDCWILARRLHGPNNLLLMLYVEGNHYKALRQRHVPGGLSYRTHVDSGDLRIYVYGSLARDSEPVVQEVNALRRALRERFNRLPAWR